MVENTQDTQMFLLYLGFFSLRLLLKDEIFVDKSDFSWLAIIALGIIIFVLVCVGSFGTLLKLFGTPHPL